MLKVEKNILNSDSLEFSKNSHQTVPYHTFFEKLRSTYARNKLRFFLHNRLFEVNFYVLKYYLFESIIKIKALNQ